jgi:3-methyladenine DNA glycosylase Tag
VRSFDEIYDIAADRKGGPDVLEGLLAQSGNHPKAGSDARWLSTFARAIFQAGFNWKIVEAKWPGFEAAFAGFDPPRVAMMDDAWFDRLLADTSIIRNGAKIRAVQQNAVFLTELAAEHGSATRLIDGWPAADYAGLLDLLRKRGARLGGTTGQYALRFGGRDGYILSRDVVARLVAEGVIDKPPTSRSAMARVQDAFNAWAGDSGRGLTAISRVLAMSIG